MFCLVFVFNYVNFCAFMHSVIFRTSWDTFVWNMHTFEFELFLSAIDEYVHFSEEVEDLIKNKIILYFFFWQCHLHTTHPHKLMCAARLCVILSEGGQSYDELAHTAHKKSSLFMISVHSTPTAYTQGEDLSFNIRASLCRWLTLMGVYVSLEISVFILSTCNRMKLEVFLQCFCLVVLK